MDTFIGTGYSARRLLKKISASSPRKQRPERDVGHTAKRRAEVGPGTWKEGSGQTSVLRGGWWRCKPAGVRWECVLVQGPRLSCRALALHFILAAFLPLVV